MCDCDVYFKDLGFYCGICNPDIWDYTFDQFVRNDDFTKKVLDKYIPKLYTYNLSLIERFSEIKDKKRIIQYITKNNGDLFTFATIYYMIYDDIDILNACVTNLNKKELDQIINKFSDEVLMDEKLIINERLLRILVSQNRYIRISFKNITTTNIHLIKDYMKSLHKENIKYDVSLLYNIDTKKYSDLSINVMDLIDDTLILESNANMMAKHLRNISWDKMLKYMYKYTFLIKYYNEIIEGKYLHYYYRNIAFDKFSHEELCVMIANAEKFKNTDIFDATFDQIETLMSIIDDCPDTYLNLYNLINNNRRMTNEDRTKLKYKIVDKKVIKPSRIDDYIDRCNTWSDIDYDAIYMSLTYHVLDNKLYIISLLQKLKGNTALRELLVKKVLEDKPEFLTDEFINKNNLRSHYENVIKSKTNKRVM